MVMSTEVGSERLREDILLKQGYHAAEGGLTFFRYVGGNNARRRLLDYTREYRADRSCERISVNCDITGKPIIGRDTITPLVRAAAHPAYWIALLLAMGNFLFRTSTEIFHITSMCHL
jgi:hypothetical protein